MKYYALKDIAKKDLTTQNEYLSWTENHISNNVILYKSEEEAKEELNRAVDYKQPNLIVVPVELREIGTQELKGE